MNKPLLLLVFLTCLTACSSTAPPSKVRPVRVMKVGFLSSIKQRMFAGTAKAEVDAKLSFRVAGTITELPVKVGDKIEEGDFIARLDPYDYELQMQQAEANLLQTQAQERRATANYSRTRKLYETDSASLAELDAARAESESAAAKLDAMKKRLELARAQLDYTTLHAPFEGRVAAVLTEVNENVAVGVPIVRVSADQQLEVEVSIPEALITSIQRGDDVEVYFDSKPGQVFAAKVTEVGVVSRLGTTYRVVVHLVDSAPGLRSGMAAEVRFSLAAPATDERAIYVPSLSVFTAEGKPHVFVAKPAEQGDLATITLRPIAIGQLTNEGIRVLTGLSENELVVTAGVQFLKEGQQVRILPQENN